MAEDDRYRLEPVRDARERVVSHRRGELASAVDDARGAETTLAAMQARTAGARDQLARAIAIRESLGAAVLAARVVLAEQYIVRRRREVATAIGEELRAEAAHAARRDAVDLARTQLARARAEREVIERHFAAWRERKRKLAERRDD